MKSKGLLLAFIILTSLILNGCMGSKEFSTISLTISMGIDKSADGYSITYQVLNPKAIASMKSTNDSPFFLYTEKGKDMFEILRRITTISPRKLYNSHLRVVVFGEEIAKDGIQDLLDFFVRDHEFRTDYYFVIAKGTTANEVLKTITPLESVSGMEMYNSIRSSLKAWAPTRDVKIVELVNCISSDGINPVLTGVEIVEPKSNSNSIDMLKESQNTKIRLSGLGAFKKDKLVGWLSEDESKGYNYINQTMENTAGYVQVDKNNKVSIEVVKVKSKMKAYMLNNKPSINVDINLIVNVAAVTGNYNASTEVNSENIAKLMDEKIKKICMSSVNKAKKDLETDIFGFGEVIHRTYPKLWKDLKNNWNNEFTKLPVSIDVHTKVNSLGESTKSMFSKGE